MTVDIDAKPGTRGSAPGPETAAEMEALRDAMMVAAREQRYEDAASLRDRIRGLERRFLGER